MSNQLDAIVFTYGLHPPWNFGEAVVSLQLVRSLSYLYREIYIINIRDTNRSNEALFVSLPNNCHFFDYDYVPSIDVGKKQVHFINFPIFKGLKLIKFKFSFNYYFYNMMSYHIADSYLSRFISIIGIILSAVFGNAATTSYSMWKQLHLLRISYIPVSIATPTLLSSKNSAFLRILYIGNVNATRFPIWILKSLETLKEKKIRFLLKIIAPKNESNAMFCAQIQRVIDTLNLSEDVHVRLHDADSCEIHAMYSTSDIFLYLCKKNCAMDPPLTVLEAMAHGLTVIGIRRSSISFLLSERRGFLIDEHCAQTELASLLITLSKNKTPLHEIAVNSTSYITQKFSKINQLSALYALIQ